MKSEHAQEFTEGLGQVLAGAVRLADVAQQLGVPKALGLTPEEWTQRRLAGHVRLSIPERRQVVTELTEKGHSSRENRRRARRKSPDHQERPKRWQRVARYRQELARP